MRRILQFLCPHFWEELMRARIVQYDRTVGWQVDRYCPRCGRIERIVWEERT